MRLPTHPTGTTWRAAGRTTGGIAGSSRRGTWPAGRPLAQPAVCSGSSDDSLEGAGIHGPIIALAYGFDGLQATGAVTEAARGPVCVSLAVLPGVHQARRATNAPVALSATAHSAATSLLGGCGLPVIGGCPPGPAHRLVRSRRVADRRGRCVPGQRAQPAAQAASSDDRPHRQRCVAGSW